jgi:hypothetical protein
MKEEELNKFKISKYYKPGENTCSFPTIFMYEI